MRRLVFFASLVIIGLAIAIVPMPYVVTSPGEPRSVPALVSVEDTEGVVRGDLLLTTVDVREASAAELVRSWLDETRDTSPRARVIDPTVRTRVYFEQQRDVFKESVETAAAVALQLAGQEVTVDGDGAQIIEVAVDGPAQDVLRPGDVVVEAGGEPIRLSAELASRASGSEAGEELALTIVRGEDRIEETVTLGVIDEASGRVGMGVIVQTLDQRVELPTAVSVDPSTRIGGPSAGLMIALTVYDLVSADDLAAGRIVAGTGTVDLDGDVGNIGGITKKVVGAHAAGATVFLAPQEQASEAAAAAPEGIEVIPVATVEEAIEVLLRD